jgi:Toprim-like/Protein of unknown function (DUF3991)
MDTELERFKSEISLVELASLYGYELIKAKSSRYSVVMSHPDGDKVVISTDKDGHGIFFSVRDSASGSVIDFVKYMEGVNLGHARVKLRQYLAPGWLVQHSHVHYRPIAQEDSNVASLYAKWEGLAEYSGGYLENRGLNPETIALFSDKIRLDARNNVCFRHGNEHSLTGWEMKNRGFTGFSTGGKKALFGCPVGSLDHLIICESAIDAMSYYQLKKVNGFYLSFGGSLSNEQIELLRWAIGRYDVPVIVAADNDDRGDEYASLIATMRDDVIRDKPSDSAKDWNDQLLGR